MKSLFIEILKYFVQTYNVEALTKTMSYMDHFFILFHLDLPLSQFRCICCKVAQSLIGNLNPSLQNKVISQNLAQHSEIVLFFTIQTCIVYKRPPNLRNLLERTFYRTFLMAITDMTVAYNATSHTKPHFLISSANRTTFQHQGCQYMQHK